MKKELNTLQRLAILAIAAGSATSLYIAFKTSVADLIVMRARAQIFQWQHRGAPLPKIDEWGATRNALSQALSWTPDDPHLHDNLGYLYGLRAATARDVLPDMEASYLDQIILSYGNATRLRPMSPYSWVNLALALHYRKSDEHRLWEAYDRAFKYGQKEPAVQRVLAEIAFTRWNELTQARHEGILTLIKNAHPNARNEVMKIANKYAINLPVEN